MLISWQQKVAEMCMLASSYASVHLHVTTQERIFMKFDAGDCYWNLLTHSDVKIGQQ
jgi:hypothetical protein